MELESQFVNAITCPPSMDEVFSLGPVHDNTHASLVSWLDQQGLHQTQSSNQSHEYFPMKRGYVKMPADRRLVNPLLSQFQDEKLRELMWREVATTPRSNASTLGSLILTRQKLATYLGFKSFAHKNLARKVLTTPQEVFEMLTRLAEKSRPRASEELNILRDLKRKIKASSGSGDICSDADVVYPWDVHFLAATHGTLSKSKSGNSGASSTASSKLSQYLSLETCMKGIAYVIKESFGIEVCEGEVRPGEHWMGSGGVYENDQKILWKYDLYGPSDSGRGDPLGTIYVDPFARGHKFAGASHFTIRCGKRNLYDDNHDGCSRKESNFVHNVDRNHQLPIVALLFDFTPPTASNTPPLLSLSQLETLYHEWGHAMHSMLSRTSFQHLSGTRGSTDFVEVCFVSLLQFHCDV